MILPWREPFNLFSCNLIKPGISNPCCDGEPLNFVWQTDAAPCCLRPTMPQCVHLRDNPGHLGLATETIAIDPDGSGPLPSLTRTLTRSRDNLPRPTGFVLGNEHAVGYGYDVSGRLATLSAQGLPNLLGKTHAFEYAYEVTSNLFDKVTGPVHEVDNAYEHRRDVLLQKSNTRTVGTPAELSVIGYTVNAIGQREQRNLSGEIRADFYSGQSTDLYTTDWGYDALGQVIVHHEYDPFGSLTRRSGAPATRYKYRFSTKPRDPATGLYYYGYRWFDPYAGSWPSRDPIEERGGVNLYGFVGNAAILRIDILGLSPEVWTFSGIQSYNEDYKPNNNGFEPYVESQVAGYAYSKGVRHNGTALWPGFVGAHRSFSSEAGMELGYALPFDRRNWMPPLTEHTLDKEAARMAKSVNRGEFCGGKKKTKIKAILFAPKTDTLPDQGCCDIQFVVYWSSRETVPNQGISNDAFTSRESQEYWNRWSGNHTYNVNHGVVDGFFRGGQHGLGGFIDGRADAMKEGRNPFEPGSRNAPHPVHDYIRPWYRGDHEGDIDYIFIGHSQGTNIMMHTLKRACCIGEKK